MTSSTEVKNEEVRKPSYTDRLLEHVKEAKVLTDKQYEKLESTVRDFSLAEAEKFTQQLLADQSIFTWGKYKGKSIEEIYKLDKKYVIWASKSPYLKHNQKEFIEDLIAKLN